MVRSLARKPEESILALHLLLELSRSSVVQNLIGNVQGCILLLVTFMNSEDSVAAKYASEILDNLSFLDQNVIEMARLNYGAPLLQHLCSGIFFTNYQILQLKRMIFLDRRLLHNLGYGHFLLFAFGCILGCGARLSRSFINFIMTDKHILFVANGTHYQFR